MPMLSPDMKFWLTVFSLSINLLSLSGWQLVLKVPKEIDIPGNFSTLYQIMTSDMPVNENIENAQDMFDSNVLYKSELLADWDNRNISLLRLAFYSNGVELAHIVFNTAGPSYNHSDWPVFDEPTNQMTWFDCDRIVASSWDDLSNDSSPGLCSFTGNSPYGWTIAILKSPYPSNVSQCENTTGWFYVEGTNTSPSATCTRTWPYTLNAPQFVVSPTDNSGYLKDAVIADMMAVFVDDCVAGTRCPDESCWQDPLGQCYCQGYKCSAACVELPCENNGTCVVDEEDDKKYTCDCVYGFYGDHCQYPWDRNDGSGGELSTGGVIGLCISGLFVMGIVVGTVWCWYIWKHRDEEYGRRMTKRAVMARDFVRRSFRRMSGRRDGPQMKQMKESPQVKHSKSATPLDASSSSVFGATNAAFSADDIEMTPPPDRRYTEFPTNEMQAPQTQPQPYISPRSLEDIHIHENMSQYSRDSGVSSGHSDRYQSMPFSPSDHRMTSVGEGHIPSHFDYEVASSMSELSSVSGHSDPRYENIPANLPPSEMISRDVSGPAGKALPRRQRPKARSLYPEEPKRLAPQLPSKHITAAAAESRRYQNVPDPEDPVTRSAPWQQGRMRTSDFQFHQSDIQEASV